MLPKPCPSTVINLDDCLACSGCLVDPMAQSISINELLQAEINIVIEECCVRDIVMAYEKEFGNNDTNLKDHSVDRKELESTVTDECKREDEIIELETANIIHSKTTKNVRNPSNEKIISRKINSSEEEGAIQRQKNSKENRFSQGLASISIANYSINNTVKNESERNRDEKFRNEELNIKEREFSPMDTLITILTKYLKIGRIISTSQTRPIHNCLVLESFYNRHKVEKSSNGNPPRIGRNLSPTRTFNRNRGDNAPLILSDCPGTVTYIEKRRPDMLPFLSGVLSAQQIGITYLQKYFFEKTPGNNIEKNIHHKIMSITQCPDKGLERDVQVDYSITAKDIIKIIKEIRAIQPLVSENKPTDKIIPKKEPSEIKLNGVNQFDTLSNGYSPNVTLKNLLYPSISTFLFAQTTKSIRINDLFHVYVLQPTSFEKFSFNRHLPTYQDQIILIAHITGIENLLNILKNKNKPRTYGVGRFSNDNTTKSEIGELHKNGKIVCDFHKNKEPGLEGEFCNFHGHIVCLEEAIEHIKRDPFNIINYDLIDTYLCRGRCQNGPGLNITSSIKNEKNDFSVPIEMKLKKSYPEVVLDFIDSLKVSERKFVDHKRKVNNYKVEW